MLSNLARIVSCGVLLGSVSHAALLTPEDLGVAPRVFLATKSRSGPEQIARAFLIREASTLGLDPNLNDIKLASIETSPIGQVVRFDQVSGGVKIDSADLVVALDHDEVVSLINNSIPTSITAKNSKLSKSFSKAQAMITQASALKIAYGTLGLTASPTFESVETTVASVNGGFHQAFLINLGAPLDHKYGWELLIDAEDGSILRSQDMSFHSRSVIQTAVFDPNPTIKSGHAYGTVDGYTHNNNVDSDFFASMMTAITLDNLTAKDDKTILTGPNVTIADMESPQNADCDVSSDSTAWNYTRSNPCFDAVSAYYFIDKQLRYLNDTLGFNGHPIHYDGGIKVDPNGLDGDDNSHYVANQDYLAFGTGGVHDAQDHDVVIHELGHAIHNWLTHGHLSQVDGLSEGIGDYWAASYDRQFMKPDHVAYNWTFSYDGHNEFWDGRVLNITLKYPEAVKGENSEIHTAGQLWATACMDIYDTIGKLKADKIFWTGISMLTTNSSQNDAAKAYLAAAERLYPDDADLIQTVSTKFAAHGYHVSR